MRAATALLAISVACACSRPAPDAASIPASASPAHGAVQAQRRADAAPAAVASAEMPSVDAASAFVLPGAFAPDTTLDALRRRYGATNVVATDVPGAEGESIPGVVLFPHDPSRRATCVFQDAQRNTGLSAVSIDDAGSRWRLDNGVAVGMPLAEVLRLNGKPIRFHGLEWDYGGTVTDLGGGRLADDDGDAVHRGFSLAPRQGAADGSYPVGDSEFSSDDPRHPHVTDALVVGRISVSFPGEDDL